MAKDAKPAEEGAEAPPKKSKKLLIIILAVVLLLVLGGGAAFMLLKKGDHAEDDEETAEETAKPAKKKDKKKDKEAHPVFINLDAFTVNLVPETGDQYLQVALSLEVEDVTAEADIKTKMPKIRNNLTLLLSSKKASELLPKEGKEKLAEALKEEINSVIEPPVKSKKGAAQVPDGPVKAVLFTSFIIQ
ncbi:MAG: flagellar basal body protein FliL [Azonexaceae bacterium]|nr:flagellar basal body protein FliL [Azonexaceae bacterium]